MPNAVYHRFSRNDSFETTVMTWPSIIWWSGTGGYGGNLDMPSGSLSLYGGVRARFDVSSGSVSGLEVYPLDEVDTHSIDKVIQISGSYPATGTINIVRCTNTQPTSYITDVTDTRWYDTHYRAIELLYNFHSQYNTAYDFATASYSDIHLFHIPSMYYDRQISTGTVKIDDYSTGRVFIDDGYGQILLSGTREQWGAVFYVEGLIVMTPPAVSSSYVIGAGTGSYGGKKVQLQFSGSHPIVTKTFLCRMHESVCNMSRNPTWSYDEDGTRYRSGSDNTTYVTAVGLYNEDYELVAVAKLAQPIRKREQDRIDIRLRLDI